METIKILVRILLKLHKPVLRATYSVLNRIHFWAYDVEKGGQLKVNGLLYVRNGGKIKLGHSIIIHSGKGENPIGGDEICRLITEKSGQIIIGNDVGISNSTIYAKSSIIIDDHVKIGGGCRLWDTNFHSLDPQKRQIELLDNDRNRYIISKPIHIKKNAFIGGSSIILKGVTIGENAIVAAGSVVTKDIPDGEIWGGNPAMKIR